MGLFTKDIETLDDAFVHVLQTTYYAEKEGVDALPTMIGKATSPELKHALQSHLDETRNHVARLEEVFRMHGAEAKAATCPAIDGILKAGNSMAGNIADKQVLDAALIDGAQMAEHYEIAQYGTLVAWAKQLGREDCAKVLAATLADEKAADATLSRLAEAKLNLSAGRQVV